MFSSLLSPSSPFIYVFILLGALLPVVNGLRGSLFWGYLELLEFRVSYFLRAERAYVFACRFGVFIRFSVEEALSLSVVAKVEAKLWSTLPSPFSAS